MASPQLENGFTRISNELLEALSRARLSPAQTACLLCVIRKTYGYGKKADKIPLSQFCRATGLKKQNASRALKALCARKIIVISGDDRKAKTYRINKDYEQWKLSSVAITDRKLSSVAITTVISSDDKLSSVAMTSKERKKLIQKKGGDHPPVPYQAIVDLFNSTLGDILPAVKKLTKKRRTLIKARWHESENTRSLKWWEYFFRQLRSKPFLLGNNNRGWRADFDWILKESNFINICEGKYDR